MKLQLIATKTLLCLALAILTSPGAKADIDKKFYKKAAEKVWAMDLPQFNAAADLSDSLYQNRSAVFIARYNSLVATHDVGISGTKESLTGISKTNAINAVKIDRVMVKINDASGIEDFNTFTIDAPKSADIRGFTIATIKPAFGARIIKPDGSVTDVNMEEALTVTKGKKNKDAEYKIAIPGLEPGAVLDYFYYTEYFLEEQSLPGITYEFFRRYPTKDFVIDIRLSPTLAFEYGAYNNAPLLEITTPEDGLNRLSLHLTGIDALEESTAYYAAARQSPYIEAYVLNNSARLEFVPKTSRPGGVHVMTPALLLADIADLVKRCQYPENVFGDAESMTKEWQKAHPEATEKQIADAAFMSLRYSALKNREGLPEYMFSKAMAQLLGKFRLTTPARVAVTTSRDKAPVNHLTYFLEPDYVVKFGKECYFPSANHMYAPAEIPGGYDTETVIRFDCEPDVDRMEEKAKLVNHPRSRAKDNFFESAIEVSLNPDNQDEALVSETLRLGGTSKLMIEDIITVDQLTGSWARFLGQKPLRRISKDDPVEEAEQQRKDVEKLARTLWNCDEPVLDSFEFKTFGCTPDSTVAILELSGKVPGATTLAGKDILVNIGKFIGTQNEIKGAARKRDISIILDNAHQDRHSIRFKIPKGYEVVPESVTSLNRSIVTAMGTFVVEAGVGDGYVTVQVIERYPVTIAPASEWPEMLRILDSSAAFSGETIVLRPI